MKRNGAVRQPGTCYCSLISDRRSNRCAHHKSQWIHGILVRDKWNTNAKLWCTLHHIKQLSAKAVSRRSCDDFLDNSGGFYNRNT